MTLASVLDTHWYITTNWYKRGNLSLNEIHSNAACSNQKIMHCENINRIDNNKLVFIFLSIR